MRRLLLCGMLVGMVLLTSGCGTSATEERLKTGEERALELKEDAKQAVDEMNEDTMKLNETANAIDEALEE